MGTAEYISAYREKLDKTARMEDLVVSVRTERALISLLKVYVLLIET